MRKYYQRPGESFPNDHGFLCDGYCTPYVLFIEDDMLFAMDTDGIIEYIESMDIDQFKLDIHSGAFIEAKFIH